MQIPKTIESKNPGQDWINIVRQNGTEAFAAAFSKDAVLDTSVIKISLVGVDQIGAFFSATTKMYDTIAFTHETLAERKTYLEWEGKTFGQPVSGVTVLTRNEQGQIESVQLYHRPFGTILKFSAELGLLLREKFDPSLFAAS